MDNQTVIIYIVVVLINLISLSSYIYKKFWLKKKNILIRELPFLF